MSRIESFPIDLGDSYEKVLNSCGLDEYDQNSVIITRNRVLEEIRSSIHQRRGNSLKSTMLDLKAYTTDYAKQQCDDLQEQLKELSDEKDVLKKDNDKKDKRVSECNAKITELESYYYKYITLCDYIVRINANPVREVITETIMRYSKKGKIKDSDHTFTGEVREILIALIRDEFRDYSLSNDNVSHEALYEKINMNIDFEATIGDRLYKGGLFSRSAKQSDFVDFSDKRTLCLVLDEIQQKNNMVFNEITPIKSFVETNNIEANLNSLINYIKEQCSFDEDKSLCYFLEQFSNATKERIATIIANQESFVEKYDSIEKVLGDYKDNILVQISANNNSLECIKEQLRKNQQAIKNNGDSIAVVIDKSNDGVEKLNFIQESIDSVSQKTDYVTIMLNSVKDNIGPDSEILGLLSSMNSCIGNEEDNSESDWSIKKNFCDINKKIEELLRKIELQDEMIRTFGEKYKYLEKSQNNMLKMIVVGELISVISVITLIMMQIF